MAYRSRIVDTELRTRLGATGATLIEGPKSCGKTATALQVCESTAYLDVDANLRSAADLDPFLALTGETPRLIDEWQLVPSIWNAIRQEVDRRQKSGQFVLTGSAVPADDETRHTGAGRFTRLRMRPMSLFEKDVSSGEISVKSLLEGNFHSAGDTKLTIPDLAREVVVGGWPQHFEIDEKAALLANQGYVEEICRVDISRVDGIRRDPSRVRQMIRSIARNVSTQASIAKMAREAGGEDRPIQKDTAHEYYDSLTRLFVVEDQPAWGPHLRSRSRLTETPKRHFTDPSLGAAALGIDGHRLLDDLNLFGLWFESLVIRDLRIYSQSADAKVLHARDDRGREVDAVVETRDGRWAAFEVKLGTNKVDEAAANLLKFSEMVDARKSGEPVALGVIVGNGFGYQRKDGVLVIPIGALGP